MEVYIQGLGNISPQHTIDNNAFLDDIVKQEGEMLQCVPPSYKDYIKPILLRRMSRLIKMGISAAKICLQDADVEAPGGIISGTGLGLVEDTEKFLMSMLDNNEELLTPTAFIQSTHNTLSGQVAIALKCYDYNNTYSHRGFSFESALLDGAMLVDNKDARNVLVSGFDEITPQHYKIIKQTEMIREEPTNHLELCEKPGKGTVAGEGVGFFLLDRERNEHTYACLNDLETIYKPDNKEFITKKAQKFLARNEMDFSDIDVVVTGMNGDSEGDAYYRHLLTDFTESTPVCFKHLCGEYHTSNAFGLWAAAKILKHQTIPEALLVKGAQKTKKAYQNILIYNHYRNTNHSFILLSK